MVVKKKKKRPTNGSKRKINNKSHWGQTAGYGTGTLTLASRQNTGHNEGPTANSNRPERYLHIKGGGRNPKEL